MKKVAVIGEGAWGTAIASVLASNDINVNLWCYHQDVVESIKQSHENKRFKPGYKLSPLIQPTTDLQLALEEVTWVFEAIPVQYLRSILTQAQPFYNLKQQWVVLSKGIEQKTLKFPSEMIQDVFGKNANIYALLGPSYADDLMQQQITAVSLAASTCEQGFELQQLIVNNYFRPYVTTDLIGVQLGGALKNVLALALGMMDGAHYGDNAKMFVLTRGLHEMVKLARAMGALQETMYGLSGVGDLVLTAMGSKSRNREVGKRLGSGQSLDDILEQTGYIPEGINTVKSIAQLSKNYNLELHILQGIYSIIFEETSLDIFLKNLIAEPLGLECD